MENLVSELLLMEKTEGVNIDHLREMLLELSNTEKSKIKLRRQLLVSRSFIFRYKALNC